MTDESTESTGATEATETMETPDAPALTLRSGESPLKWLARIAPDDWEATEDGYGLILQSGDRRVMVDSLNHQATFNERVEVKEHGRQWRERELIEGQWYLQTTAGLLLWGIGDDTDTDVEDAEDEATGKIKRVDRVERASREIR